MNMRVNGALNKLVNKRVNRAVNNSAYLLPTRLLHPQTLPTENRGQTGVGGQETGNSNLGATGSAASEHLRTQSEFGPNKVRTKTRNSVHHNDL